MIYASLSLKIDKTCGTSPASRIMKSERGEPRMKKPYEFLENLNLPQPMYRLTLRPTVVLIAMAALGVIVLIAGFWNFKPNGLLIFFGLYFIGMVVFSVVMVKDRIIADLYDDQVVLYDKQDQRYGVIIPLSETYFDSKKTILTITVYLCYTVVY